MKTLKHATVTGSLGKIVKPPAIFLLFGLLGFAFLAEGQGQTFLAPPGTYLMVPGQSMVPLTEQNMPPALRRHVEMKRAKQNAYDRLHEWVNKMRKPLSEGGVIKTQRNAVEYLKYSWKFVDLGLTGNDIAMEKALFDFQMGANNCMRVVRESMSRTNVVPVVDYREYFVCLGRAAAIGDLINQFEQFRMARSFAAKRIQIVNRDMASSLRNRKPGNIANEHLKKWAGEGYQELMNYWNGQ